MNSRRRFDLIIFDNDGVLVDSERIACQILSQLVSESGTAVSFTDAVEWYMGHSPSEQRSITRDRIQVELAEDFEERYSRAILDAFSRGLSSPPGMIELLDALEDMPVCVASNGDHERLRLSLAAAGLLERFNGRIFSAQDVRQGKPAPDLLLMAAKRMNVVPGRCAVIEDSAAGIAAATAAGMTSFGLATLAPYEVLKGATGGVVSKPLDLLPFLTAREPIDGPQTTIPSLRRRP
jgi:HAD superfamily hydrolase (TIGR01509 family)